MVNVEVTVADARAAERELALGYASAASHAGLSTLFALDTRLGAILRGTREPLVGQMRLTWWHEALSALDRQAPPAEPVLAGLAATVLPQGVTGSALAAMIDGWEVLLDEAPPDDAALIRYAEARGSGLFGAAARVLGLSDPQAVTLGEGWALADLATHVSDPALTRRATALALTRLDGGHRRWPLALRPLVALALLARSDLADGRPGSPGRVARLIALRLSGYGLRPGPVTR